MIVAGVDAVDCAGCGHLPVDSPSLPRLSHPRFDPDDDVPVCRRGRLLPKGTWAPSLVVPGAPGKCSIKAINRTSGSAPGTGSRPAAGGLRPRVLSVSPIPGHVRSPPAKPWVAVPAPIWVRVRSQACRMTYDLIADGEQVNFGRSQIPPQPPGSLRTGSTCPI